jgi:hypothetical protein
MKLKPISGIKSMQNGMTKWLLSSSSKTPSHVVVFQKTGGVLEALPMEVFRILQEFVSFKDYLNLMNANLFTFQPITNETARYMLSGPEKLEELGVKKPAFARILESVKDKSRQVSMIFDNVNSDTIVKSSLFFDGIYKLIIAARYGKLLKKRFPFKIFDNVYHLVLKGVHGVKTLSLNSNTLKKLEVISCRFHEIRSWNNGSKLQSLVYFEADNSIPVYLIPPRSPIPSFEGIPELALNSWYGVNTEWVMNAKSFTYKSTGNIPFEVLIRPQFSQQLISLILKCGFPATFHDFSFCSHIQFLTLTRPADSVGFYPQCPTFYGQEIKLQKFSLSAWNGGVLPNVKKCHLTDCVQLTHFPALPLCRELHLQCCMELTSCSPEMPFLSELAITDSRLKAVPRYPNLKRASLRDCHEIKSYDSFSRVNLLGIQNCAKLTRVGAFKHVQDLCVESESEISLDGIQGTTSLEEDDRIISFNFQFLPDLRFCHHICQLELNHVPLSSLNGIHNIHHLTVTSHTLVTTKGITAITGSLTITSKGLKSVEDVANIPVVTISSATYLSKFTGLGGHEELHICSVVKFEKYLKEFQEGQEHEEIFSSIQHLYLKTRKDKDERKIW